VEDEGRRKKAPIRFGPKLLELLSKLGDMHACEVRNRLETIL